MVLLACLVRPWVKTGVDKTPTLAELIGALRRDLDTLREDSTALYQENATLRQENAALKQKVAELLRRLDKSSSNSSKPPSSNGLKKPPRVFKSLRGRSGKSSDGPQRSPHCVTASFGMRTPAFEMALANVSISGASLCSGMVGMRS